MSKKMIKAGVDIGYGTLDGVCTNANGGKKPYQFYMPSLVSEAVGNDYEFEGNAVRKRNIEKVIVGSTVYHVGEDAGDTVKELNEDYIYSDHYMALYIAALQRFGHKQIDHLVTGLPVFQFDRYAQELEKMLQGRFETQMGPVNVKRVSVVPQPLGSLIEYGVRTHIKDPRRLNVVVVDPGHYSFDWLLLRNGSADLQQSGSHNEGVAHVIERIQSLIAADHNGDSPSAIKIDAAFRANDKNVHLYGKPIPLKGYLDKALRTQASAAIRKMKNRILHLQDVDSFILTGGGASLFHPCISEHFKKHKIEVMKDSVMANALGYFHRA